MQLVYPPGPFTAAAPHTPHGPSTTCQAPIKQLLLIIPQPQSIWTLHGYPLDPGSDPQSEPEPEPSSKGEPLFVLHIKTTVFGFSRNNNCTCILSN